MYEYKDRIRLLQERLETNNIDYYYIPLSDYHNSEIPGEAFNVIKFLTGFSGSNATLVVTSKAAYMWTDGRYFIQAEKQLDGSGITLMKQGLKDVPKVIEFLDDNMGTDDLLAFNGRLVNVETYERFSKRLLRTDMHRRICDCDLVGDLADDIEYSDIWELTLEYSGESAISKIDRIRDNNRFKAADGVLISDLCDIAWTLNLRGDDLAHVKVFFSYLIITNRDVILYVHLSSLQGVTKYLDDMGVVLRDYDDIYTDLSDSNFYQRHGIYKMLIDLRSLNTSIYSLLKEKVEVLSAASIPGYMKCIKNQTEIDNTINAHIKDGVAVTKFIYQLDKLLKTRQTELSLANRLHELRAESEGFLDESFDTISAWAEHGAIVHYEPTLDSDVVIDNDNFLLVDSGGHYLEGTTDITRTFLIGKATPKMIRDYTLVLKSNINLAKAKFLSGTSCKSLDILARDVLWSEGVDFLHGTGHGVGHILSVHEGPNNISFRNTKDITMMPGMITTDEPGIYLEGEYGIRLENELLCVDDVENSYGTFYRFECLTLVPFQRECIDKDMLTDDELLYLNDYHRKVYEKISPYLDEDEKSWFSEVTKEI